MVSKSSHRMVAFEYNAEQDTLICYVYIAFEDEPKNPKAGWYRHEFNKPEDIRNNNVSTGEELEIEMRKQAKKFGACDIMEQFQKSLQPLDWERVAGLPKYTRENYDDEKIKTKEKANKKRAAKVLKDS